MPGFDRTGPIGRGPQTGRGLGPCGMGYGRAGFGRGFGRGMGFRRAWADYPEYAEYPTKEQEIADLKAEKELMEKGLESLKQRLKELENKK